MIKKFLHRLFERTDRIFMLGIICILLAIVIGFVIRNFYANETAGTWQGNTQYGQYGWIIVPATDFSVRLLSELGIAFLIAVAIAEGIEKIAHDKQAAETRNAINEIVHETRTEIARIKTNLLEAIYDTKSAGVFFQPFEKYVLKRPLLRTDCTLQINIKQEGSGNLDANSVVVLDVTITFTLENCSKSPVDISIPSYAEHPWPQLRIASDRNVIVKNKKADSTDYEDVKVDFDEEPGITNYSYKVHLESGSHCDIIASYTTRMFARDRNNFISLIPTDKMNIFIYYTPLIDLFYKSIHYSNFIDKSVAKADGKLHLLAAEPLLPGNGIEFWWCPKPAQPPQG
jgi:hypothetical protein